MPGARKRSATWAGPLLAAFLVADDPAAAARRPITGKLSKPGYTVIALADGGKARSVRATSAPVQAAGAGRAGHAAPARSRRHLCRPGHRRPAARPRGRRLPRRRSAGTDQRAQGLRASRREAFRPGCRHHPLGPGAARRPDRHWSLRPGALEATARVPPVPTATWTACPSVLDIDDDGDLVLDSVDRSGAARAAQGGNQLFNTHSDLTVGLEHTANANAPGATDGQLEAALPAFGRLDLAILSGDSAELDCGRPQVRTDPTVGGLVYCSRGGTGRLFAPAVPIESLMAFPDCCDGDGDGFGTLTQTPGTPPDDRFNVPRHQGHVRPDRNRGRPDPARHHQRRGDAVPHRAAVRLRHHPRARLLRRRGGQLQDGLLTRSEDTRALRIAARARTRGSGATASRSGRAPTET